ncbi:MAG: ethanolamine ammonia-lyase reactivating factor EutA [Tenacibaculum sp.]|nr:ethanolamine ammonia-lyase reactivating factor EutA [Tenacibaculum sp.]
MLEIRKYGAIDIGSNAIRLLIANVIEQEGKKTLFRKSSLVRVPIRLGADVFTSGNISEENITRMVDAMKAFKLLINVHKVEKYKACATSAMREASNGLKITTKIKKETGINIDIIDGEKEATIISSTDLKKLIKSKESYLYVDVGGGSTEFTIFSKGNVINTKSFKIGTVRLLNNSKKENKVMFEQMEEWIERNTKGLKKLSLIGSGGNINKVFKMSGREIDKPLSFSYMNSQYKHLKKMSYKQRILKLGLNPDRADVIIPAMKIYLSAMKWSEAKNIFVPKIGLSDGIIKSLYNNLI